MVTKMFKIVFALIVALIMATGCATSRVPSGWQSWTPISERTYIYSSFERTRRCSTVIMFDKRTTCLECFDTIEQQENPVLICDKSKWYY